ncbi:PAS domain-containing protein [Methylobacterium sp. A54F]
MIFVTDVTGQRTHASQEWEQLTGQEVGASLGRGWLARVHADDRDVANHTLDTALKEAAEFSIRYRLLKPDNSFRWVIAGGVPSFGPPDSSFIGYLGSLTELADGATDAIGAYGNVGRFVPPPTHAGTAPSCMLDQTADCLLLAHSLIEQDGGKAALPSLRVALFEIGRALAARTAERIKPLN